LVSIPIALITVLGTLTLAGSVWGGWQLLYRHDRQIADHLGLAYLVDGPNLTNAFYRYPIPDLSGDYLYGTTRPATTPPASSPENASTEPTGRYAPGNLCECNSRQDTSDTSISGAGEIACPLVEAII
jgi:hypothetical protein